MPIVKQAIERVIAERRLKSWNTLTTMTPASPNMLKRIRDGQEMNVRFGTVHGIAQGLGMTLSEFFMDAPGWADRLAIALRSLGEKDLALLRDILARLSEDRAEDERQRLAALASALSFHRDNGAVQDSHGR